HNTKYTSPALTQKVFTNIRRIGKGFLGVETPLFDTMLVQPQVQDAAKVEGDKDDEKVAHLEHDKVAQALEIVKLKQRVKKLEKKKRFKSYVLKRLRKVGTSQRVESSNNTIVDAQEDASKQGENARIFDEQIAKRLQDEEIKQMKEKHLDNIKKYQSLKRKPISIAQSRKNMIVYLKNIAGYKIQHFKGMTYDHVRPIFEREYNKVQTFLKSDRDEEPTKKRAAKETLLQESFKKLREEVKVSGSPSTQKDTPNVDPTEISKEDVQNMLQIVPVAEFKVEALQVKYLLIDWEIHFEGSRFYWKIIRVDGITKAYQSFEDMLKSFNREDLDAL
nr:hypothetical protein [Tanacetum cinerariifolium]